MRRRAALLALAATALPPAARAQADWRRVAVPMYGFEHFVAGNLAHAFGPWAEAFAAAAARLHAAARVAAAGGPGAATRAAWRDALVAWARLSSVAVGPLLERRSPRRIDFQPVRPEAVVRAVEAGHPADADLERVGSAGKGFGALEWLWWNAGAPRTAAARTFAVAVAREIADEADALRAGFAAAAAAERDEDATVAAAAELVNQWIGAIQQLRLQGLERPLLDAGARAALSHRRASGAAAAERQARWDAIAALAVADGPLAPPPGRGAVPLESFLRGRGLNEPADRLAAATRAGGAALRAAAGGRAPAMRAASQALAALGALAEGEIAPALDVRVGFSDADGD